MKNLINNIMPEEHNFKKIDFGLILNKKKNLYFVLSNKPIEIIEQIEKTQRLSNLYHNLIYIVDEYFFDFINRLKRKDNVKIISLDSDFNISEESVFINFNRDYNLNGISFQNTIVFDINNNANFVIKPHPEGFEEILRIFYKLNDIKVESETLRFDIKKKEYPDYKKAILTFDIQSSANEKSVEVLLKNLQQYSNLEIYLIWRTGSIDFDYSHIDVENFLSYYQAVLDSDIFFTDDKEMLQLMQKLKLDVVFLGKGENHINFNPKNIFEIKNYIFSRTDAQ